MVYRKDNVAGLVKYLYFSEISIDVPKATHLKILVKSNFFTRSGLKSEIKHTDNC